MVLTIQSQLKMIIVLMTMFPYSFICFLFVFSFISSRRCGWTIINLFSLPPPQDLENGHENVPTTVSSENENARQVVFLMFCSVLLHICSCSVPLCSVLFCSPFYFSTFCSPVYLCSLCCIHLHIRSYSCALILFIYSPLSVYLTESNQTHTQL